MSVISKATGVKYDETLILKGATEKELVLAGIE